MNPESLSIHQDIRAASTLDAIWYRGTEPLELERSRIFGASWHYAGLTSQLGNTGDFVTIDVAGEPIVVCRQDDGSLRAFHNVCRHRAGRLARGHGCTKAFRCSYHGWTYGLDGKLKFTPEFKDVHNFNTEEHGLRPVHVESAGPFVFVRLSNSHGPTLSEWLGSIPDEIRDIPVAGMRHFRRHTWEIDCNWKVYVDNYLEGYHIPVAHPGLFREIDYPAYRTVLDRFYSRQDAPVRARPESLYMRNIEDGASPQALYYWVFPNLMLNFYPDNLQVNTIVPLGPRKTATVFDWYFLNPDRPGLEDEFRKSFEFSQSVQQEDIQICLDVQQGLESSSYRTGRYSPERETGLHHFHRLYAAFMTADGDMR